MINASICLFLVVYGHKKSSDDPVWHDLHVKEPTGGVN